VNFNYRGQYNAVSSFKTVAVPSKSYTGSEQNFVKYSIGEKGWNLVNSLNPRSSNSYKCPVSGFSVREYSGGAYKTFKPGTVNLNSNNEVLKVFNNKPGNYKIYLFSNQPRRIATDLHVIILAEVCGAETVTADNL